jgi:hypothetical protein
MTFLSSEFEVKHKDDDTAEGSKEKKKIDKVSGEEDISVSTTNLFAMPGIVEH